MKNQFILLFLFSSLCAGAQKISGFYSGTLYNDTTKMVQQYELALSEYKGKISGYSYVTFISNDTFYYGIRKIKADIVGDSLVVEDDKIIINNFPEAPARRVGRIITIPLNGQDSLTVLSGRWRTNRTRKYYSVPGSIELSRSQDSSHSPLIAHLKELNLIPNNNYTDVADAPVKVKVKEKEEKTKVKTEPGATASSTAPTAGTVTVLSATKTNSPAGVPANATTLPSVPSKSVTASGAPAGGSTSGVSPSAPAATGVSTPGASTSVRASNAPASGASSAPISGVTAANGTPAADIPTATSPSSIPYRQRKMNQLPPIEVASDSLVLSFYDNGVVDGDSISVYLNGRTVVQGARLATVANKKTISIAGLEESELVLVADNLGSIPPNTGLLVIRDGNNTYQINFSADLQTNAAITIRRKKG